jgi:hypothetical protein
MLDVRLLFDAPKGILVIDCILDLTKIWQLHYTCISNIHIQKHIVICHQWRSHIQLYLSIKHYIKCSLFLPQSLGIN